MVTTAGTFVQYYDVFNFRSQGGKVRKRSRSVSRSESEHTEEGHTEDTVVQSTEMRNHDYREATTTESTA